MRPSVSIKVFRVQTKRNVNVGEDKVLLIYLVFIRYF